MAGSCRTKGHAAFGEIETENLEYERCKQVNINGYRAGRAVTVWLKGTLDLEILRLQAFRKGSYRVETLLSKEYIGFFFFQIGKRKDRLKEP